MKKILIHLFPFKFIEHDYKIREFAELEKKFKVTVVIHDLSEVLFPKSGFIKAKNFKNSIKFKSLGEWIKYLDKLKKKNVVFLNELNLDSFKSLIIHYYLKKNNFTVFLNSSPGTPDDSYFFSKNLNFEVIKIKFIRVCKNPYLLFYFFKKKLLTYILSFFVFNKIILFIVGDRSKNLPLFHSFYRAKNKKIVRIHFRDYSNFLNHKKNYLSKKSKPIIFIDSPFPYFKSEEPFLFKQKDEIDIAKWYKDYNLFFDKLENYFSTKLIIVPHPKNKGVTNPFLKKRSVDHRKDAILQLTSCSLFFLCGMYVSTAISFPVSAYKPIFFLNSEQERLLYPRQVKIEKESAKIIGSSLLDVNNFRKKDILKNMKVKKKLYDNYKYTYLTSKKILQKPNHIILGELI